MDSPIYIVSIFWKEAGYYARPLSATWTTAESYIPMPCAASMIRNLRRTVRGLSNIRVTICRKPVRP